MSKFKLDFDISSPNPVRRLVPRVHVNCPQDSPVPPPPKPRASQSTPNATLRSTTLAPPVVESHRRQETTTPLAAKTVLSKSTAPPTLFARVRAWATGAPKPTGKGLRVPISFVCATLLLFLFFAWVHLASAPSHSARTTKRTKRTASLRKGKAGHVCLRHTSVVPSVTCENTCAKGQTCVAQFASAACADSVQSMHVHYADGRTERMPAVYRRVPNTTMFFLGAGDRTTFQPAACRVQLSAVFAPPTQTQAAALRKHLVWLAPASAKTFRVFQDSGGATAEDLDHVATVDAHLVQDRCVQAEKPYCVHKLEMQCRNRPVHVFSVDPEGGQQTRLTTFVYC